MVSRREQFIEEEGLLVPPTPLRHRSEEYDEQEFDLLLRMQREHFWYRGRHRLLLHVLRREIGRLSGRNGLRAIDLGGGCGGWIEYLQAHGGGLFENVALGDSSRRALTLARDVVGAFAERYQVDLLDLPWAEEWDVAFLLDVIEHIPEQEEVLRQVFRCLRPGGLLFVTAPALKWFWTYNDEWARHQRRYRRDDFRTLAGQAGFELLRSDYFMFFLSLPLILSRLLFRPAVSSTPEQVQLHAAKAHRIPARPFNWLLGGVFSIEASLVNVVRLPWGTSILGVFRR